MTAYSFEEVRQQMMNKKGIYDGKNRSSSYSQGTDAHQETSRRGV
jgi:hypothetical protein